MKFYVKCASYFFYFTKEFKYDVFISYNEKDKDFGIVIKKGIEELGLTCFMASESGMIEGGESFEPKIFQELAESREICLICTPNTAASTWVHFECGAARALNKRIIPIICEREVFILYKRIIPILYNGNNKKVIPDYLGAKQYFKFSNISEYYKDLEDRIEDYKIEKYNE